MIGIGQISLDNFFKLHYILVHFPLALILLAFLLRGKGQEKLLDILIKVLLLLSAVLCSTGAGLALMRASTGMVPWLHICAGAVMFIFSYLLYFYRSGKVSKIIPFGFPLVGMALISGVFTSFGSGYFLKPLSFEKDKILIVGEKEKEKFADFQRNIRPILDHKCAKCHNENSKLGGLDLTSLAAINGTGQSRKFYISEQPDRSGIYLAISDSVFSKNHMPYFSGRLSTKEIETVRRWINDGGLIPAHEVPMRSVVSKDLTNWSFKRFAKPEIPELKNASLAANEVDAFYFSKREKKGLIPKISAVLPEKLLRRLSLTTTGLIPGIDEIRKKTQKNRINFEKEIDSYLASRHFSENFTAHWFDLSGFGDNSGFDSDLPLRSNLAYRKFVLNSWNRDLPYFSFLRAQLPVGFKRADSDKNYKLLTHQLPQHRDQYITADYALNTIFSFTLGLEMRCARCHDHKYEPISNESYYQLLNIYSKNFELMEIEKYQFRNKNKTVLKSALLDLYENTKTDFSFWMARRPPGHVSSASSEFLPYDVANWLTDTKDGIGFFTARVYVDSVWRFVFGKGLVDSAGYFGAKSKEPEDLDLLNWLTYDFLENGQSTKYLLKRIMKSRIFQSDISFIEGSRETGVFAERRMKAENIRDNLLLVAGLLNLDGWQSEITNSDFFVTGHGDMPVLSKNKDDPVPLKNNGVEMSLFTLDPHHIQNRRSIYFNRDRTRVDAFSTAFGIPNGFSSVAQRDNSPNSDEAMFYAANHNLAFVINYLVKKHTVTQKAIDDKLIENIYLLFFSRSPTQEELSSWREYFTANNDFESSLRTFFHILLSSREFLYVP